MTIEEIRKFLVEKGVTGSDLWKVMDAIVALRSDAFNQGWDDGRAETISEGMAWEEE